MLIVYGMQNDWSTLSALYSMHISYPNTCFFLALTNHYESTLSRLLCPITLTSVFAKMHPIVPSWLESQVSNDWRLSSWYRTMGLKPFQKMIDLSKNAFCFLSLKQFYNVIISQLVHIENNYCTRAIINCSLFTFHPFFKGLFS